jgi:hypothetical protein
VGASKINDHDVEREKVLDGSKVMVEGVYRITG